jgi:hypothetical protein
MPQLTITSKGIPELQAWLKSLAKNVVDIATKSVANYIVGDATHGLMHAPDYKYVNRYAGFPGLEYVTSTGKVVPGFASAKQHRYVMAMIAQGKIKPGQNNRTGNLTNSYRYAGQGSRYVITNDTSYAKYVVGGQQTRMHNLIGWRTMAQTAKDNMAGAIKYATAKVKEWLRMHGKK